jgi:2-alkyl-3-oxoalkanoate reductase
MRMLVTGAGGFLGTHVVAAAVRAGHHVDAMIRPASRSIPTSWQNHPQVRIVRGDLRAKGSFDDAVAGADCVVHLAASKAGDLYEQFGCTVIATENLLDAMLRTGRDRLVVTSSFSVYEYLQRWAWSGLDESSPLADPPRERDEYCQTKLEQERIVHDHVQQHGGCCVMLRPGVIYGRDNLWTARIGMQLGSRLWLGTGMFAPLPLTYAENCADAIVRAAEHALDAAEQGVLTLNVVDDETPSQRAYMTALARRMPQRPRRVFVPWTVMRMAARSAWLFNKLFLGGRGKIPGLFIPARLHARCKPLRYSNARIRSVLGWQPAFTWQEGIDRSLQAVNPTALPVHHVPVPAAPLVKSA